jgi:microcystin-dependent protein
MSSINVRSPMSDAFLAEIRIFAGNFAPSGWALCNGQLLPISQNTALFALLGTTYGGDGRVTFALPDLQQRVPMQQGQGPDLTLRELGETGGSPTVTLGSGEMPTHSHTAQVGSTPGNSTSPTGAVWAQAAYGRQGEPIYSTLQPNVTMNASAVGPAGGGLPHNNMPPYLCLTFIIALQGIFPQRP